MDLKFENFRAEHVETLAGYYGKRHDRTCDSTIMDNFLWGGYYHIRFCERDGKAVLWIMNIDGKDYAALPVCGLEDLPHYFKELEQYFNEELHLPLEIFLADEEAVEYLRLPEDRYSVEELPDARDYIYSAESLKVLSGKKLGKKKNHINYLKREYAGRYEYRTLCCSDGLDVWQFLDKWRAQKGQEVEGHLDYEVEGIHDILRNCSAFHVHMGGIYIDGRLEAFAIGSYNEKEKMAIIHIEKANPEIRGLYQFINQQFLIHEFPEAGRTTWGFRRCARPSCPMSPWNSPENSGSGSCGRRRAGGRKKTGYDPISGSRRKRKDKSALERGVSRGFRILRRLLL